MGLSFLPSRLPLIVVIAAHAARTPQSLCSVRVSKQRAGQVSYEAFTLHDPSAWLAERLTPAQCRIARLWIEGEPHGVIAANCVIKKRTVANHMAAIYQTLGVSGRLDLLLHLAEEYARGAVPVGPQ
jgi:DNA-binding NarL/FixJ family response regulator